MSNVQWIALPPGFTATYASTNPTPAVQWTVAGPTFAPTGSLRWRLRVLRALDTMGHWLYTPLVRNEAVTRWGWRCRVHLLPFAVVQPVCDAYEHALTRETT